MTKIYYTRKYNLTTKLNKEEFALVLSAFEASSFKTLGQFFRETLISALHSKSTQSNDSPVPTVNLEYANNLLVTLHSLQQLVEHLNQSLINDSEANSKERVKYLNNAIQLVHDTAKHSLMWFHFFSGDYDYVIKDIAFETLDSSQLYELADLRKVQEL